MCLQYSLDLQLKGIKVGFCWEGPCHVPQETLVRDVIAFENAFKDPKTRMVPVFGRFLGK